MNSNRAILHVDMDAFYASVEQLDAPELRGVPVVVGADPESGRGRGVVAACSYEARRYGIHSALPIGKAWRLCPHGAFLRPRMGRYVELSRRVFAVLRRYTDLVEPLSIDEAFLDVTGSARLFGAAEAIGREIKRAVLAETGLVASVGVAPNKFVAKIASDLQKPDGFVVVKPADVEAFLSPLPISRLWGVGPKGAEKLRRVGIRTIGDLARGRSEDLAAALGGGCEELWRLARGLDERPVVPESEAKSLGAETTFAQDTGDPDRLRRTLLALSDRVAARLRRQGLLAGGVVLKYRDETFRTLTRSATLAQATDLGEDLYGAAVGLLRKVPGAGRRVRLLGVTATRLLPREGAAGSQLDLFSPAPDRDRRATLARAVDGLKARFGDGALLRAVLLDRDEEG